MKLLIIAGDMMMSIFANLEKMEKMGTGPIFFVSFFWFFAWRRLHGEKTVRKAEWAWFLSEVEINGDRPHLFPGAKATCFLTI
jgi:hypothetical protein